MLTETFASLLGWALGLGPWGGVILPAVGAAIGIALLGGGYVLREQRIRRHARDLLESARRRLARDEEGRRAVIVGTLRAPSAGHTRSFATGRPVCISTLLRVEGRVTSVIATRLSHGLVLDTPDGPIPIHGTIHLERTRAPVAPRAAELSSLPPHLVAGNTRVLDASAGEPVMVEGFVGRVEREGLREQAAALGFTSATEHGHVPIRLTALRPELPRAALAIALAGALVGLAVATPWPVGLMSEPPFPVIQLPVPSDAPLWVWRTSLVIRLLSPDRDAALEQIATGQPSTGREALWRTQALTELGRAAFTPALTPHLPARPWASRLLPAVRDSLLSMLPPAPRPID